MSSDRILALDFDGVICASSTESSVSSILAAKKKWPTLPLIPATTSSDGTIIIQITLLLMIFILVPHLLEV